MGLALRSNEWRRVTFKAMGGPCEIRAWASSDGPLVAAVGEIRRLEEKYSRYLPDSVTTRINNAAGKGAIRIDAETGALLRYADDAWRVSQGQFDITSGVLRRVWDFKRNKVPDQAAIDDVLKHIGWQRVQFDNDRIEMPSGMELDFGGIVKEYTADRAAGILREQGTEHGLVDLAGDISAAGPLPDDSPWIVRIRHPRDTSSSAGVLRLQSGAVATSGDYERCIIIDGQRYSHILDPLDGWPARGLASATVRHESCIVAGTLATIAILKGRAGAAWLTEQGVESLCLEA